MDVTTYFSTETNIGRCDGLEMSLRRAAGDREERVGRLHGLHGTVDEETRGWWW